MDCGYKDVCSIWCETKIKRASFYKNALGKERELVDFNHFIDFGLVFRSQFR